MKKQIPIPPNDRFPIEEARDFFAAYFFGEHHIPGEIKPFGYGWKVVLYDAELSTFDFSGLTRLVILAHDRCVRASVSTSGFKLSINIFKRQRSGGISQMHPNIETAIANIRESKYYNHGTLAEILDGPKNQDGNE